MKYLKRIVISLIVLILLLAATVFTLLLLNKNRILAQLTLSLKTNYGILFRASDITVSFWDNWPHVSARIDEIYLTTDSTEKSAPLLRAGSVSLSFDLEKLIHKQIVIRSLSLRNAEINLTRNADGSKNFLLRQRVETVDSGTPLSFEVSKVTIKNTRFAFSNAERKQHIALRFVDNTIGIKHYSDGLDLDLGGKLLFEELLFNPENGAFLKNKRANVNLQMNYFKRSQSLCVHPPSYITIEEEPYNIACLLGLSDDKKISLLIESRNVKFEKASRLLTPAMQKTLSNFALRKPLAAGILLVAPLEKRQEPIIVANIEGRNCDLTIGKSQIPYSGIFFRGKIVSLDSSKLCGNSRQAKIEFTPVTGKIFDFPFSASVSLTGFKDPNITINADLSVDAAKVKTGINKEFQLDGSCKARINYHGPAKKLNKEEFLDNEMHLLASIYFNDLSYTERSRPHKYVLAGKAALNNRDLKFEKLKLRTDAGDVYLNGKAEGFVHYVLGYTNSLRAGVVASAEIIDLNPFIFKRKDDTKSPQPKNNANKTKMQAVSQSHFEFNVSLAAGKLIARKVEATSAAVDVLYKTGQLTIRSASMNVCGGKLNAKGALNNFRDLDSEMELKDVDVKQLFEQFENFGQKAITKDHLKGTVFAEAKFSATLDDVMEVKGETMRGAVKLKLKDGHLINFTPLQKISRFVFKNRDFNDITFSELNENFRLNGYEMEIDELEIASNVLNLFVVNGIYNFKGNANINVLVPWSNLRRREKDHVPRASGESAENTKGLKLNFSGPSDHLQVNLGHRDIR